MKISFVGLGNMGDGMAANLVKAGHEVRAFDLSDEALGRAMDMGCQTAGSMGEVADAEAVVSMLANGEIVLSAYTDEVFDAAPAGAMLLDARRATSPPRARSPLRP